ncbi:SixA phosphatase family protein [Pseudophaeobacter flagellatus]|uniref:SixA phosphatase family protein n=1 Tax=Pseudophaeobacter flagellatus TaxID=2899119 RepID=UPI001E5ABB0A|nr:histidine phosphatase family protein [Pseudophaeobacter flagellatus]MCD9149864.1 histidine phosphatase family protein [Pseudophaeobacter flagellatus]
MTRTLILTRHAKSAWDTKSPSDHARPLNNRGYRSAAALGDWLRLTGQGPDQILCSSAQRSRETQAQLQLDVPTMFIERLYHASPDIIFQALREAEHSRVMLISHNPGIAAFAHAIVATPPDHNRFGDYPTGATMVARFDIDSWADLNWGTGRVMDFVVPRELLSEAVEA